MKFEHAEVFNFEGALRGMRNPLESWSRGDSEYKFVKKETPEDPEYDKLVEEYVIGPNDLQLAQRLINGGSEHRKFMRQIFVCVDITAPLYWWKEADTYQTGVTKNSTSTMHKIMSRPFLLDSFETDDMEEDEFEDFNCVLDALNRRRELYLKAKEEKHEKAMKRHWKAIIRLLPESWLQTRTITMNYENLYSMVRQRKGHKLTEWHSFIEWVKTLPYAEELIFYTKREEQNNG